MKEHMASITSIEQFDAEIVQCFSQDKHPQAHPATCTVRFWTQAYDTYLSIALACCNQASPALLTAYLSRSAVRASSCRVYCTAGFKR